MFSTIFGNVASAMSCSNINSDTFDDENEMHSIFSACFDVIVYDHKKLHSGMFSVHYFGSDDDDDKHTGSKIGKHEWTASNRHYEHRINWSAYKLKIHEHDDFELYEHDEEDDHKYQYHHGSKGHHGFKDHYVDKRWLKGRKWYRHDNDYQVCLPGHGGEVPAVPVPAAFWLFGSGLVALFMVIRRKG
jgi:hypothetical protein